MDAIEQLAVSHHVTKLTHFENRNRIESIQHFSFVGNFFSEFSTSHNTIDSAINIRLFESHRGASNIRFVLLSVLSA